MATPKKADKFPLWLHPNGQWCKKIRGRARYFGTDRDAALKEYVRTREELEAGRDPPPPESDSPTIAEMVNSFLTAKRERVTSGELTAAMWGEYYHMSERVIETLGKTRHVASLRPSDFGKVRAAAATKLGPAALSKFITMARTMFLYGYDAELLDVPVRYGSQFDKPPKRVMRLQRHTKGKRFIHAADVWKLLDKADVQVRAMIFLALNAGFGQTDCANLTRKALAARPGWVDYPRLKSGIGRRVPLWSETMGALDAVEPIRPEPKDSADADLAFVTIQGNRWCCYRDFEPDRDDGTRKRGHSLDAVARNFRNLCKAASVNVAGGFYTLRHVFRTVADEVKDRAAIDLIMGHADHSMANYYREHIADERLQAVVNHVRDWLMKGQPPEEAGEAPTVLPFASKAG